MDLSLPTMTLVPLIAVAAPLLVSGIGHWVKIPLVVFEIVLGLLLGPAVLGWVRPDEFISLLAEFGLAMLFFLAGNEIDFRTIRGRPLGRSTIGWLISLAVGVAVGVIFAPTVGAGVFIGVALTSTALGTLMPILMDAGEMKKPFGIALIAVGAVGEFGPLIAISVFLSSRTPADATVVLLGFAVVAGLAIWLAARPRSDRLHKLIASTLHTSGQFAIRLVILVLLALVALSIALGLDMLLGAFTAGVLYRALLSRAPEHDAEVVESKLEGIGYGFLVPLFFINTGMTFDLKALLADHVALALVPVFVVLLLLVRGLPSLLSAPIGATRRDRIATILLGATGLPIIVAVTDIGAKEGDLSTATAAALVGAGMLSVLLFPLIGLAVRRKSATATSADQTIPDIDPFVAEQG